MRPERSTAHLSYICLMWHKQNRKQKRSGQGERKVWCGLQPFSLSNESEDKNTQKTHASSTQITGDNLGERKDLEWWMTCDEGEFLDMRAGVKKYVPARQMNQIFLLFLSPSFLHFRQWWWPCLRMTRAQKCSCASGITGTDASQLSSRGSLTSVCSLHMESYQKSYKKNTPLSVVPFIPLLKNRFSFFFNSGLQGSVQQC